MIFEWMSCDERLPDLIHRSGPGPLSTGRRFSDLVLITWKGQTTDGYPDVLVARLGQKDEADWGAAAAGDLFWFNGDLLATHGKPDRYGGPPTHWAPYVAP